MLWVSNRVIERDEAAEVGGVECINRSGSSQPGPVDKAKASSGVTEIQLDLPRSPSV